MKTKEELIAFERRVADLWEAGKIDAPVHLSGGNEDELIDIFRDIRPGDWVFSTHRNHYHALLKGVSEDALLSEILGERRAPCGGRARSMGFISREHRLYSSAIVGGLAAAGVGVAFCSRAAASVQVAIGTTHTWCFVGDGAVDGGHLWECLNYAVGWNLPITFVLEDNARATCTTGEARNGRASARKCVEAVGGKHVRWYEYTPTWPHVGTGKYVQF